MNSAKWVDCCVTLDSCVPGKLFKAVGRFAGWFMEIFSCVRFWLWRGFGRALIILIVFVVVVIIDWHDNCARRFSKQQIVREELIREDVWDAEWYVACPPHLYFFLIWWELLRYSPPHFNFAIRPNRICLFFFHRSTLLHNVQLICSEDWPLGTMIIIIMPFKSF